MFGRSFFELDPFGDVNRYFDEMDRYMASRMGNFFDEHSTKNSSPQMIEDPNHKENNKSMVQQQQQRKQKPHDLAFPRLSRSSVNAPFKMDMSETEKEFVIHAELPGTQKEDIQAQLEDNYLTISAERRHNDDYKDSTRHVVERSFGKFQRSIRLPETVDSSQHSIAAFNDGLLTLKFTKKAIDKGKKVLRIDIQ